MQNLLDFPANFFMEGGLVEIGNQTAGLSVAPGQTFIYSYVVPPTVRMPGFRKTGLWMPTHKQ